MKHMSEKDNKPREKAPIAPKAHREGGFFNKQGGARASKPFARRDGKPEAKTADRHFDPRKGVSEQYAKRFEKPKADKAQPDGKKAMQGGTYARPPKRDFPGRNKPANGPKPAKRQEHAPGSDARIAALKALYDVYYLNAYSNLSLDKQLKQTELSPEDRRLATNIFYQCVENRRKIEFMLEPFIKQEPEQIITCILHIAAAQILFLDRVPEFAAVNEAVKEARLYKRDEAAGFVNVVLRNFIRAKENGEIHLPSREEDLQKYLEITYSASKDAVGLLCDAFGAEEAEKILSYKPEERYETIRPNLLRYSDAELESALNAQEIAWEKASVPHGYYVKNAGNLAQSELFTRGLISIQGVSAMLAAMALEAKRGMTVLDACAAPGGKAALICELMQGSGRVYAWDLHDHRVEMMKNNGKRLGLDNLRCAARDATQLKDDMTRLMDAVIIDAPCTGLGVIADKPDIKYHLTRAKLKDITSTQEKLLDTCCEYVKVGGRLVYSTCTLLPQENREQIDAFLLRHPEFKLDTDTGYLPEPFRARCENGMLSLFEHRDGVEGFFIARLIRVL